MRATRGRPRVRWQAIPLAVLIAVLASYLLLEGFGLVSFQGTMDRLQQSERPTVAAVIFALLVVDALVPVPSTPLMVLAGRVLGTPAGAAVVVSGSMATSAVSYVVGRFAGPWLRRRVIDEEEMRDMQRWSDRFGRWMFVLSRGLPMMSETVGISAGVARVPVGRFLGYTLLGTLPICLVYVMAGVYAETAEQIVMVVALGFLVPVALWYAVRRRIKGKEEQQWRG